MLVSTYNTLNEYTIHSKIGGENLSTIYEATHKQNGVKRAVKVMDLDKFCAIDSEFHEEVNKRIDLIQRINNGGNTNIVHYHRISHFDHHIILEMQYIHGATINDYIKENKYFVEVKEVINLIVDIGRALKFLHCDIFCITENQSHQKTYTDITPVEYLNPNRFVLHNDIHTLNILRDISGKYILIDLDFAIEGKPTKYEKLHRIDLRGMSWFRAPEKWGDDGYICTQSDVYSFGVVIYWFLTGEPPFTVNDSDVTYDRLIEPLKDIPTSILKFRKRNFEHHFPNKRYVKDYPNWLEELILRCLKKDPNERFKDGNELLEYVMLNLV